MKRAEMLRLMTLAPAGALLAACAETPSAPPQLDRSTLSLKDREMLALRDRAIAVFSRLDSEDGLNPSIQTTTEELLRDIDAWQTRFGSRDIKYREGLVLADIPEDVQLYGTRAPTTQEPDGKGGCRCVGYWRGCWMYLPYGKDTCNEGSCAFVCIDWFCRLAVLV